jgi:hypothetical protein
MFTQLGQVNAICLGFCGVNEEKRVKKMLMFTQLGQVNANCIGFS